jgi:glycine cleavage system H protein
MEDIGDLRFTRSQEWVRVEGKTIVVGLTDEAQRRLSDITRVELPEPGDTHFGRREEMGVIESLKTACELHSPVSGVVVEVNTDLLTKPEIINSDPYGSGWIVKMAPDHMSDVESLMDIEAYEAGILEGEEEE